MRIVAVRASQAARRHMRQAHRVELWEVDEALVGERQVRRIGPGRLAYEGSTLDGRRLRIVFEVRSSQRDTVAHIVTAFPV